MDAQINPTEWEEKLETALICLISLCRDMGQALASRDANSVLEISKKQEKAVENVQDLLDKAPNAASRNLRELAKELCLLNDLNVRMLLDELETTRFLLHAYGAAQSPVYTESGQTDLRGDPIAINIVG
jgi:hypothetical protein